MASHQADRALSSDGAPRRELNTLLPIVELNENQRGRELWPVFVVSFTALYLEILLIRWIGTEVRVFAYFQNLALIACFLGFGLGCYQSAMKKRYLFGLVALTILVILVELPFHKWKVLLEMLSSGLSLSRDAQLWSAFIPSTRAVAIELFLFSMVLTSALLLLIIETMRPVGQWVGMHLDDARDPIAAYSVNLLGSIAGSGFSLGCLSCKRLPYFGSVQPLRYSWWSVDATHDLALSSYC